MARHFLIDGYNALHRLTDAVPDNPDAARRVVVERAKESMRRRGASGAGGKRGDLAHVVFDARKGGGHALTDGRDGPVTWSYADGSADEEIVEIVREREGKHDGRMIVVVSDDRELRGRASQLGADTLKVHEWFEAKDAEEQRKAERDGPPLTASDFGLPDGAIDLSDFDPDAE